MHFDTTAVPAELPALLRRFVSITAWGPWKSRLSALQRQMSSNPLLRELFEARYYLEFEMDRAHRALERGLKIGLPATYEGAAFLSFVAMTVRVHQRLVMKGQRRLAGMIKSGLDAEHGLAPVQFEMLVAAHLMRRDFDVGFSDIESGGGFDFLAERDGVATEVECKTVSGDLGRKIHLRRLYQFGGQIHRLMVAALDLRPGGQLARVRLTGRFSGSDPELKAISERLNKVLNDGASDLETTTFAIEYRAFAWAGSPFEDAHSGSVSTEAVRRYVEQQTGLKLDHLVIVGRPRIGAVVVAIESLQPDAVMRALVEQLKDSVKRQFSGTRPGGLCVRFSDVTESELMDIVKDDRAGQPSSLQKATSYLLGRDDWKMIRTLAYFTPGHLLASRTTDRQSVVDVAQEQGRTYTFTNLNSAFSQDPRLDLF